MASGGAGSTRVVGELARSWSSQVQWRKMEAWGTMQSQGEGDMLAARLLFTWCGQRWKQTEKATEISGVQTRKPEKQTVLELRRVSGESSDLVLKGPASPLLPWPLQPESLSSGKVPTLYDEDSHSGGLPTPPSLGTVWPCWTLASLSLQLHVPLQVLHNASSQHIKP